jgi:hypothetical protein
VCKANNLIIEKEKGVTETATTQQNPDLGLEDFPSQERRMRGGESLNSEDNMKTNYLTTKIKLRRTVETKAKTAGWTWTQIQKTS